MLGLDSLIAPLRLTLFHPLLNLTHLLLSYSSSHNLLPVPLHLPPSLLPILRSPTLLRLSTFSLLLHALIRSAQAWRDGSILPPKRMGKEEWVNQIAVVTGGSGGLGASISQQLIQKGAKVAILDIAPPPPHASLALFIKCDIGSKSDVEKAAEQIRTELGDPTIVINNAGVQQNKLLVDLTEEELDLTLNINLKSHFLTLKSFLPSMLAKKKGHIITTISALGYVGVSGLTDYCASKHALIGFVESLRYELDKKYRTPHIRTTNLILGQLRTPLFSTFSPPTTLATFLSPIVEPSLVATKVVEAIERKQSRWIMLPFYVHSVAALKMLPSWARDLAQVLGGADEACPQAKIKSS